jgi:hypothetical protein
MRGSASLARRLRIKTLRDFADITGREAKTLSGANSADHSRHTESSSHVRGRLHPVGFPRGA